MAKTEMHLEREIENAETMPERKNTVERERERDKLLLRMCALLRVREQESREGEREIFLYVLKCVFKW